MAAAKLTGLHGTKRALIRKRYTNVGIPAELITEIDKVWKKSKKGYRSRAEFVIEGIREKINKEK